MYGSDGSSSGHCCRSPLSSGDDAIRKLDDARCFDSRDESEAVILERRIQMPDIVHKLNSSWDERDAIVNENSSLFTRFCR